MKERTGSIASVRLPDGSNDLLGYRFVSTRPALSHWVTAAEADNLRHALAVGRVPLDLEVKLMSLRQGDFGKVRMEQTCRWLISMLMAAEQGVFPELDRPKRERLLQVLAYVRKHEDSIPDYTAGGYVDDQQEVNAVATEFAGVIHAFKAWHLRNHVPALWGWAGE